MLILGIESSCDETAAALVKEGKIILSNVIASQVAVHRKYGGVVPELASRHHLENIVPIVEEAFAEAGLTPAEIHGLAVTQGPGLVGSLLVGINYAKALSYAWNLPLVAVHHLEGHIYSVLLELARQETGTGSSPTDWPSLFPAVALVVSGGHTSLYYVKGLEKPSDGSAQYQMIGRTRDDAAGEAFDKVAKLLRLGYPGGPIIDRLAPRGDPSRIELPVTRVSESRFDFSFSGIKTAVLRYVEKHWVRELEEIRQRSREEKFQDFLPQPVYDLVASFQQNVVNSLFQTTLRAVQWYHPKSVFLAGGVACNSQLRNRFKEEFEKRSLPVYFPSPVLSTDNAAMIAAAGYPKLLAGEFAEFGLNADVHLQLA